MRISDCSSYVCSSDLSTILRQILLSACVHIDGAAYSLLSLRCLLFTRRDRLAVLPPQFGRPDDEPPFFRVAGAHQAGTGIPKARRANRARRDALGPAPTPRHGAGDDAGQERPEQAPGQHSAAYTP